MFAHAERGCETAVFQHLSKILLHGGYNGRRSCGIVVIVTRQLKIGDDAVDVFGIGMLFIITVLISYIQNDIYAAKCSQRQPEDVDKTVAFVAGQKAEGSLEVIFEHNC